MEVGRGEGQAKQVGVCHGWCAQWLEHWPEPHRRVSGSISGQGHAPGLLSVSRLGRVWEEINPCVYLTSMVLSLSFPHSLPCFHSLSEKAMALECFPGGQRWWLQRPHEETVF